MTTLDSSQRKYLRGLAHPLKPILQIGKEGVSEGLLHQLDQALDDHELVKVRFNAFKDEREELAATMAQRSRSAVVGMVGHVVTVFRSHAKPEKRKIHLP